MVGRLSLFAGDRGVAEEAVQEALARAWTRIRTGQEIDSLSAWVAVVATNVIRRSLRRRSLHRRLRRLNPDWRRGESAERGEGQAARDSIGMAVDRMDLVAALLLLPAKQRQVVVLHYLLDLPVAEVAREMRMTDGAVKATLYRARRSLAHVVGEPESEEVMPRHGPQDRARTSRKEHR